MQLCHPRVWRFASLGGVGALCARPMHVWFVVDDDDALWAGAAADRPTARTEQTHADGEDRDDDGPETLDGEDADQVLYHRADIGLAVAVPIAHRAHRGRAVALSARLDNLAEVKSSDGRHDA